MLNDYLASLKGRRVTVIGIGISNRPLLRLLAGAGARVEARDKKDRAALGAICGELEALGVSLVLGPDYLRDIEADVVFRTPGLRPDNEALTAAARKGAVITSEMEVFFENCPCDLIAVTGSDGKTTTTTLISEMLRESGRTVWLGGNIGTPLLDKCGQMRAQDIAVLELSSFQLMSMRRSPRIAVITNLSPNHLDVHRDMAEYVDAKCNIFRWQNADGLVVLNADNEVTRSLAAQAAGRVRFFSRRGDPQALLTVRDGALSDGGVPILPVSEIRLPGVHNVENFLAACAAVRELVPHEVMAHVARTFAGVEHRMELCRELGGVKYYNDSIGSSPTRTIAGLRCFSQRLILIAGGYDKHLPFDELGRECLTHVRLLILCGATADKIEAAVRAAPGYDGSNPEIVRCGSLEEVVALAHRRAAPGDIVFFSPACASFDQFPNFEVRGRRFKELVNHLK